MALPPFAPFPPAPYYATLPREDWPVLLTTWATLATAYQSQISDTPGAPLNPDLDVSACQFLRSFVHELASHGPAATIGASPGARNLRAVALRLIETLLQDTRGAELLTWDFLADLSRSYGKKHTSQIIGKVWHTQSLQASVAALKRSLTHNLEAGTSGDLKTLESDLARLNYLIHASPNTAAFLFAGSDFLDGLIICYRIMNPPLRQVIITTTYLCLMGLTDGPSPKFSMLNDQLYALRVAADLHRAGPTNANDSLVPELVTVTPVLKQTLHRAEAAGAATSGLRSRITALEAHRKSGGVRRPKRLVRRKVDKGKGLALEGDDDDVGVQMHVHRASQITQIQDLFPELGSGFVAKLLDEYRENVEHVIAHLLEDSLPPHLQNLDRTEKLSDQLLGDPTPTRPVHAPNPSIPVRRNIYDDDELDQMAVKSDSLHFGKRNPEGTADDLLRGRSAAPQKAAILSALAAFDLDDDERDDTYDVDDVGGTVDPTVDGEADGGIAANEETLYRALLSNPELFNREASTRRSAARAKLRDDTGMADEAIEGWALMLERSSQMKRRLEAKYSTFDGAQVELGSTRWNAAAADNETVQDGGSSTRGGRGGRGRGGRGRGRGGNPDGPPGDEATEVARRRKEASKGSRANHNRRDQRARKMARGGLSG